MAHAGGKYLHWESLWLVGEKFFWWWSLSHPSQYFIRWKINGSIAKPVIRNLLVFDLTYYNSETFYLLLQYSYIFLMIALIIIIIKCYFIGPSSWISELIGVGVGKPLSIAPTTPELDCVMFGIFRMLLGVYRFLCFCIGQIQSMPKTTVFLYVRY